jgi:hypothetical protein
MKVKFSENISENFCCADDNLPSVCWLSKEHTSNILGTVSCVKLKLTTLVVGDVELTKRQYLHHNTNASTPTTSANFTITATTTTATKAKTTVPVCCPCVQFKGKSSATTASSF